MNLGGYQAFSLCDFPARVAAVVFLQGCNFRCPYCHNQSLLATTVPSDRLIPASSILKKLHLRRGVLDGVVISGGEPTLQADLPEFIIEVRGMGFRVKLDTNGSHPSMVENLLAADLLDYVAMDVKAPWPKYDALAGKNVPVDRLQASVQLLAASGVEHEFRTTFVPHLLTQKDLEDIKAMLPSGSFHRVQQYRAA
jgi:pyruvate formate lyase activating enzyme